MFISEQDQLKDVSGLPFSHGAATSEVALNSWLAKELALWKRCILFLMPP